MKHRISKLLLSIQWTWMDMGAVKLRKQTNWWTCCSANESNTLTHKYHCMEKSSSGALLNFICVWCDWNNMRASKWQSFVGELFFQWYKEGTAWFKSKTTKSAAKNHIVFAPFKIQDRLTTQKNYKHDECSSVTDWHGRFVRQACSYISKAFSRQAF